MTRSPTKGLTDSNSALPPPLLQPQLHQLQDNPHKGHPNSLQRKGLDALHKDYASHAENLDIMQIIVQIEPTLEDQGLNTHRTSERQKPHTQITRDITPITHHSHIPNKPSCPHKCHRPQSLLGHSQKCQPLQHRQRSSGTLSAPMMKSRKQSSSRN